MKEKFTSTFKSAFISGMLILISLSIGAQTAMPPELSKDKLKEQLKYIEEHTIIYENYRAIREDMFQRIKANVSDTLSMNNNTILSLKNNVSSLKHSIDSLNSSLAATKTNLDDMTKSKNSIKVLGIELNKVAYNSVMWSIVGVLVALLVIGFLVFKRNLSVIINLKKELRELKEEFEAYRKTTREAREKMSMAHFNELKKLRGE